MTVSTLQQKASAFRALHIKEETFVMPNAWDAGSAIFLQAAGFAAIATTSGGVNWSAGREDYVYGVTADEMLDAYGRIAAAVDLPVSGDLENGYGAEPEVVAATISSAVQHGMVGGGIEDWTGDPANPLYDTGLAVERIKAARQAADASGIEFTLTARCEAFFTGHENPYAEVVKRCNLFAEAGADCVFAPGLSGRDTIRNFVNDVSAPVSMVTGLADPQPNVAELADLGVRRISTGGSLARACFGLLQRAARDIAETGEFTHLKDAISDSAISDFFRAKL